MDQKTVDDFIEEKLVSPKAKLEAFLATNLELRTASQLTIPAEFPTGLQMGQQIDQNVQPHMTQLQQIQDMRARVMAVQVLKKLLEKNFEEIVETSEEYKVHYNWTKRLELRTNQVKVRPTVHELYLFKDRDTGKRLNKLMSQREKIRRKVQRKPGENVNSIRFAYPEEFDYKWLLGLGAELGYPECCVKQYAEDRKNGVNVEARASKQLLDLVQEKEIDPHVYYTGYFFPCSPECENALKQGHKWHDAFSELHETFGELYLQDIYVNSELVLKQPELIRKYLSQFRPKAKD